MVALPGGVDHQTFRPFPLEEAAARLPALNRLRAENLLVLNIGSNLRRKNLPTLLQAIHLLRRDRRLPVKLGSEHQALVRQLGLDDAIVELGSLRPPQVAAACRLSHALAFPSLYEGFGRPTVEAQACELPCVLADSSCMREVGGGGALYHAPTNAEELADALARVLTAGSERAALIAAGTANARRFTWSRYAEALIEIYAEVAR